MVALQGEHMGQHPVVSEEGGALSSKYLMLSVCKGGYVGILGYVWVTLETHEWVIFKSYLGLSEGHN